MFEGHVEGFALTDFLQAIHLGGRTGFARITQGSRSATVLFRSGRVECASSAMLNPLGAVLVSKEIITKDELRRTLRAQRERHRHHLLASLIAELGLAPFRMLESETSEHIRAVFADLLSWNHGVFVFQPHEVRHEVSVLDKGLNVEELLLASMFTHETITEFQNQSVEDESER
jgi:hypothetical protein